MSPPAGRIVSPALGRDADRLASRGRRVGVAAAVVSSNDAPVPMQVSKVSISRTRPAASQNPSRVNGPYSTLKGGTGMPPVLQPTRANSASAALRVCLPSMQLRRRADTAGAGAALH